MKREAFTDATTEQSRLNAAHSLQVKASLQYTVLRAGFKCIKKQSRPSFAVQCFSAIHIFFFKHTFFSAEAQCAYPNACFQPQMCLTCA